MKWYHWIWLPVVAVVVTVAYVLGRRDKGVTGGIQTELDVIEARTVAKKIAANMSAERASQWVELRHKDRIKRLDDSQRKQATDLRDDPVALAEFLVRAGG